MTKEDQKGLIEDLSKNIANDIVRLIDAGKIPEEWNGIELRELIFDRAANCRPGGRLLTGKRLKDYRNKALTFNFF